MMSSMIPMGKIDTRDLKISSKSIDDLNVDKIKEELKKQTIYVSIVLYIKTVS